MSVDDFMDTIMERAASTLLTPTLRPLTPGRMKIDGEIRSQSKNTSKDEEMTCYNSDDEYDTDIEIEEEPLPTFDNSGLTSYVQTCKKLKVNPIRQVCEGLMIAQDIRVCNRGISPRAALSIANALLPPMKGQPKSINVKITELTLDGNNIEAKGMKYLCWMLTENVSLKTLSLNDNHIGTQGLMELCDALTINTTLLKLCLSSNGFQDTDAYHITRLLSVNTILQEIDLSYNSIGDEGAASIAESLANNDYLKSLNMSWNKIRPLGAVRFGLAVKENVMLKCLDLSMNGLSLDGCAAISAALQVNDSLTHLHISNTRLQDVDILKLVPALVKNESLHTLNLSYNTISSPVVIALLEALRRGEGSKLQHLDLTGVAIFRAVFFFLKQLRELKPAFRFSHGDIITNHSGKLSGDECESLSECDPVKLICWYSETFHVSVKDFSLPDGSHSLTSTQFCQALRHVGLPMTDAQVKRLYKKDGVTVDTINIMSLLEKG